MAEGLGGDAVLEPAGDEGRADDGEIGKRAQSAATAAGDGAGMGADGGADLAAAQPFGGMALIVDDEIE